MPPGTLARVRLREAAFVTAIALVTAITVVAAVSVLRMLPRESDRSLPADGYLSPLEDVPPGWPAVQILDPRTASLPSLRDSDVTAGPTVVASGMVDGSAFTLYAYSLDRGDALIECVGFVGFSAEGGSVSSAPDVVTCSNEPAVPQRLDVAFVGAGSSERPDLVADFGFVSERVDTIYVWGGGDLGMFEIPALEGLRGWDVRPFFFAPSTDAGPLEVGATIAENMFMPLAHAEICHHPPTEAPCRTEVHQELPIGSPVDVPVTLAAGSWPAVTYGGAFEPYVDHEMNADGVVDPDVVGEKRVIAYGTVQEAPWSLVAFDTRDADAPDGVNPSSQLFVTGLGGGGAGLYDTEPWTPNDLDAGRMSGGVGFDAIDGVVSLRIAAVRLELDDGTVLEPTLIPGPEGVEARYFVGFVPSGLTGRLVALDASGNEVEQMCLDDMFGVPPRGDPCAGP